MATACKKLSLQEQVVLFERVNAESTEEGGIEASPRSFENFQQVKCQV